MTLLAVALVACTSAQDRERHERVAPLPKQDSEVSRGTYTRLCESGIRARLTEGKLRDGVRVGPVTFPALVNAANAPAGHFRGDGGRYFVFEVPGVVKRGAPVTVSVPPKERKRVSLFFALSVPKSDDDRYRVSAGLSRVTFTPCSEFQWTQFNGGFIVAGPTCAQLNVSWGKARRERIAIAFGVARCRLST